MEPLNLPAVEEYVNENIGVFHEGRLDSLKNLDINRLLRKNPYLFRAKNMLTASEMVDGFMEAFLGRRTVRSISGKLSYIRSSANVGWTQINGAGR